MQLQLNLEFTTKPQLSKGRTTLNLAWLDVSDLAGGVGFATAVEISIALNDALEPLQNEIDGDYDQRLFDALWLAHFQLSLDAHSSATFNFTFSRKDRRTEEISEINLRLRVETQVPVVLLGLLQDFH